MAWYYQTVPGDRWDSTARKAGAGTGAHGWAAPPGSDAGAKNGFYYVLDRATGELLSAHNLRSSIGREASIRSPADPSPTRLRNTAADQVGVPSEAGAHSWQPMAFDAERALTFIPVIESGNVLVETSERRAGLVEGQFTTPALCRGV